MVKHSPFLENLMREDSFPPSEKAFGPQTAVHLKRSPSQVSGVPAHLQNLDFVVSTLLKANSKLKISFYPHPHILLLLLLQRTLANTEVSQERRDLVTGPYGPRVPVGKGC